MKMVFKILLKIFSVVMCIFLFTILNLYLISYNVSKTINCDNITKIVQEIDIINVLEESNPKIITSLYDFAHNNNIDEEIINKVINSYEVKSILANYCGNIVNSLFYGNASSKLIPDELIDKYSKTFDQVLKEVKFPIAETQKEKFMDEVKSVVDNIEKIVDEYKQIPSQLESNNIKTLQIFLSNNFRNTLLIIMIISVIIIALLNYSIYRFAIWTGITTMLASFIYLLLGIALYNIISIFNMKFISATIVDIVKSNIAMPILISGLITLGIGVLQVIYYKVVKRIKTD